MTPQEIIENNILLANFMGLEFNTDFGMFYVPIEKEEYNVDSLKFHSDWNWLMLAKERIEELNFTILFTGGTCHLTGGDVYSTEEFTGVSNIEAVYEAVVFAVRKIKDDNLNAKAVTLFNLLVGAEFKNPVLQKQIETAAKELEQFLDFNLETK